MNTHTIDAPEPEDDLPKLARPHKNVAERIDQLLARCDKLKRASALRPTRFDDDGEAHARATARDDNDG
ncbi:hypothetical protein [Lacipirellula limnantheis]|uniref:Uncharacterized protein n=1 Tax=Lacipirellula limnantheis TaxID=2528024 RepID=A0A517U4P1_9BACT|nr:hypothetical protein [Lacipirellula limnantheis]QDT75578.1 hypothetical protein I41_47890 [Lacipirellula limnantheis]